MRPFFLMPIKFYLYIFLLFSGFSFTHSSLYAQLGGRPDAIGSSDPNRRDPFSDDPNDTTRMDKKPKADNWDEEPAIISYKYLDSEVAHQYDSTILFFHRNQYRQPAWYSDLGNWGSVARETYFKIADRPGLRLGYDNWDVYKYTLDSVPFINTTRPYTSFSFMLGPKQMQWVELMHTQNINPLWNFAFKISNNSSDGFFRSQKASGVNAFITSNYKSEDQRHSAHIAFIMNNFKQDENGGIVDESDLTEGQFTNRAIIPTKIESFRPTISPVHNRLTEIQFYVENSYAWGRKDTIYTADSTGFSYKFTPRFSLKHALDIQRNQHKYNDALPDTSYYSFYGPMTFGSRDTVRSYQYQTMVDNRFSLNTFLGRDSQLVHLEAGAGLRVDQFRTDFLEGDTSLLGNTGVYLYGQLKKDAVKDDQWSYLANVKLFVLGEQTIGNTGLHVQLSKSFPKVGRFAVGAEQSIVAPSFQQNFFKSNFFEITNDFGNTTNTQLYGDLFIKAIKLNLGLRNQLIGNYIYLDESLNFQQHSPVFSMLQFSGRKLIKFGAFALDNEVVWQQLAGDAPVNIPAFMLRHQLSYKVPLFKDRLETYMGIEARYHTPYQADGYSFVHNQFYYQNSVTIDNLPALSLFFNFKVKRLRAFLIGDQLQQFVFTKNLMAAPGYAMPDAHIRFGFNWIMMN